SQILSYSVRGLDILDTHDITARVQRSRPARESLRPLLLGAHLLGAFAGILALDDARRLAAPAAQIIELGAPHLAAADDLDRIDHRRIQRKHPLDALAVRNLPHSEVLVDAGAGPADTHAFIGLHAGALAFDDLDVDDERVARLEVRNLLAGRQFRHLFFFDFLEQVHGEFSIGCAGVARSDQGFPIRFRSGAKRVGAASTPLGRLCHPPTLRHQPPPRNPPRNRCRKAAHRSGRRSRVNRSASARRHPATLAWSPEIRISGIGRPSQTCGRVYCGYSSSPAVKLSSAAECGAPMTPGKSRTQASSSAMAAISPPEST